MYHDAIAVVDFGGQYAHLIATKIRRLKVLAEIRQPEDPIEAFRPYRGIILSGSPSLSSHGEDSDYNHAIYDLDVPILGFCFGHQEIAKHYGGTVTHGGREWGPVDLKILGDSPLFKGLGPVERVWMSHFDSVTAVGPGFVEIGVSSVPGGEIHRYAAIACESLKRYGVQFHPEVDDTVHGTEMIANFVFGICGCRPTWTMERYLDEQVEAIRRQVGQGSVFLLVSGGVDSTVAAKLLSVALGPERVHLLHVDNGLMRKNESEKVLATLTALGLEKNLHFVDATDDFLTALAGVIEPEKKRKIIGETFIRVFEREAKRLGIEHHLLGQGTIYPDTIETGGTRRADVIKTHHNRVPLVERMIEQGRVIEPLKELYKVEVRELGEKLGIPDDVLWRHPFPGPGLGVRLICSDGAADPVCEALGPAVAAAASRHGVHAQVIPIRSVGVKADLRSYEHPVLVSGEGTWEHFCEVASCLLKDVAGINRCVLNLGREVPVSLRPVAATVTRSRLDLLREADHIVMEGLRRHGIERSIWQCPVAMLPLEVNGKGSEFVVLRPVHSERAMTAKPAALPEALLVEVRDAILALPGISGLAIDLTTKPPGTIEWE